MDQQALALMQASSEKFQELASVSHGPAASLISSASSSGCGFGVFPVHLCLAFGPSVPMHRRHSTHQNLQTSCTNGRDLKTVTFWNVQAVPRALHTSLFTIAKGQRFHTVGISPLARTLGN